MAAEKVKVFLSSREEEELKIGFDNFAVKDAEGPRVRRRRGSGTGEATQGSPERRVRSGRA